MQTVMREFFFFVSFRFFRRIFSNRFFKKIPTLFILQNSSIHPSLFRRFSFFSSLFRRLYFREPKKERERFLVRRKSSLHFTPSRALFCDAAQKTRIKKERTRKRERNANRGHESHAFAVASRVRLYRGVHLFLSPHFFFESFATKL